MARAAAPIFRGLRVATSTTRRLSIRAADFMSAYSMSSQGHLGGSTRDADEPCGRSRVAKPELAIGLAIWRLRVRVDDGGEFVKLTWQQQKRNMAENWFDTM